MKLFSPATRIFQGKKPFLPYPQLQAEEQETVNFLLDSLRKFARDHIDADKIDREGVIPQDVLDGLAELGVMGMVVPEAYGGFGFGMRAFSRVMEEITGFCASTSITIGAHESIGIKGLLLYGTEEQKQYFLPKMAEGEWLGAYALTEPEAGSDASHLKTQAIYDEKTRTYQLNGTKQWITNGGIAHVYIVFASTGGPGILTAFLVTADTPGFQVGKYEDKLGLRASKTAQIILDNVMVSEDRVLGKKGRGFKIAMDVLTTGRATLGASCIGAAKAVLRHALDFAKQRKQFGQPIGEFEMIRHKFSHMAAEIYAMEGMIALTTGLADQGLKDFDIESSLCKVYCMERLWEIINECLQIAGGNGYMMEYPYQRFLRDARINMIFEGTNEVNRMFLAYTGLKNLKKKEEDDTSYDLPVPEEFQDTTQTLMKLIQDFGDHNRKLVETMGTQAFRAEYHLERLAEVAALLYGSTACLIRLSANFGDEAKILAKTYLDHAIPKARHILGEAKTLHDQLSTEAAQILYDHQGYPLDSWE